MKNIILLLLFTATIYSCTSDNEGENMPNQNTNKVLMLKVDYMTKTFEGGKEFDFAVNTPTFTPSVIYQSPGDFGSIKVNYSELNTQLFYGTIHWNGEGKVVFPTDFLPANAFAVSLTQEVPQIPIIDVIHDIVLSPIIQLPSIVIPVLSLQKVKEYRRSNPNQSAKIFLYTPGVGIGNPATWKWIIMFKN